MMNQRITRNTDRFSRSNPEQEYLANTWIRSPQIRLLKEDGSSEIIDTKIALDMAKDIGLDLITISKEASPPVCRIYDLSKYVYEQKKLRKEQERKNRENAIVTKEIQLRPSIDTHDLLIKQRHAKEFLEDGNKVKVVMKFRGRELSFANNGFEVINKFMDGLECKPEKEPSLIGNTIQVMISPVPKPKQ